jgi:hypothetical protein
MTNLDDPIEAVMVSHLSLGIMCSYIKYTCMKYVYMYICTNVYMYIYVYYIHVYMYIFIYVYM